MGDKGTQSKIGVAGEVIEIGQGLIDLAKQNIPDFKFDDAKIEVEATEERFILTWMSKDFDIDNEGTFEGLTQKTEEDAQKNRVTTDLWVWKLHVFEDAGFVNDEITIDGYVQHIFQPHPEDKDRGEKLTFRVIISADDDAATETSSGTYELTKRDSEIGKTAKHSSHTDELTRCEIEATITSTAGVDDFTSYTFKLEAVHKKAASRERRGSDPKPNPEPPKKW